MGHPCLPAGFRLKSKPFPALAGKPLTNPRGSTGKSGEKADPGHCDSVSPAIFRREHAPAAIGSNGRQAEKGALEETLGWRRR